MKKATHTTLNRLIRHLPAILSGANGLTVGNHRAHSDARILIRHAGAYAPALATPVSAHRKALASARFRLFQTATSRGLRPRLPRTAPDLRRHQHQHRDRNLLRNNDHPGVQPAPWRASRPTTSHPADVVGQ